MNINSLTNQCKQVVGKCPWEIYKYPIIEEHILDYGEGREEEKIIKEGGRPVLVDLEKNT